MLRNTLTHVPNFGCLIHVRIAPKAFCGPNALAFPPGLAPIELAAFVYVSGFLLVLTISCFDTPKTCFELFVFQVDVLRGGMVFHHPVHKVLVHCMRLVLAVSIDTFCNLQSLLHTHHIGTLTETGLGSSVESALTC